MSRDCFASLAMTTGHTKVCPTMTGAMTDEWIPAFAGMTHFARITHSLSRICHVHLKSYRFTVGRVLLCHTPPSSPPKLKIPLAYKLERGFNFYPKWCRALPRDFWRMINTLLVSISMRLDSGSRYFLSFSVYSIDNARLSF